MSRKTSSGKFSLPTFSSGKRDRSRLQEGGSTPTGSPLMDDEDVLGSSWGSIKGKGEGRSWSNVLKLGGGKREREREKGGGSGLGSAASVTSGDEE
jgi:hypothetical protein